MSSYSPQPALRENFAETANQAACLFVDVQNYILHEEGVAFKAQSEAVRRGMMARKDACAAKWKLLVKACREAGVEVMYTVIQSLTKDGRDRSLDYKISGIHVAPGSWDAQVLEEIEPGKDEIVLPKTSCSVFQSTNLDYILRSMEKKYLIVCGCFTDQCVSHAVRDGCDLGYRITVVPGKLMPETEESHAEGLRSVSGFSRRRTVGELLVELKMLH